MKLNGKTNMNTAHILAEHRLQENYNRLISLIPNNKIPNNKLIAPKWCKTKLALKVWLTTEPKEEVSYEL